VPVKDPLANTWPRARPYVMIAATYADERTNTNSAFYPFRGGMTHVEGSRLS